MMKAAAPRWVPKGEATMSVEESLLWLLAHQLELMISNSAAHTYGSWDLRQMDDHHFKFSNHYRGWFLELHPDVRAKIVKRDIG